MRVVISVPDVPPPLWERGKAALKVRDEFACEWLKQCCTAARVQTGFPQITPLFRKPVTVDAVRIYPPILMQEESEEELRRLLFFALQGLEEAGIIAEAQDVRLGTAYQVWQVHVPFIQLTIYDASEQEPAE